YDIITMLYIIYQAYPCNLMITYFYDTNRESEWSLQTADYVFRCMGCMLSISLLYKATSQGKRAYTNQL
ncbi:MAG: hypothetical protein K2O60_06070, partial [Ruminococcus sp.]|nr:hypothetical protein [Ruminococcus sp.]